VPDFSISIVSGKPETLSPEQHVPAIFSPDPQLCPPNAIVSWNNTTEADHRLELSDGRVTDLIIAEQSSDEYVIADSITYTCIAPDHTGETGAIKVVAIQDMPPC
jgi:hypothetical protein